MGQFKKVADGKRVVLSRSHDKGRKNLVVVTPKHKNSVVPMFPAAERIFSRVLDHTDATIGPWANVIVTAGDRRVRDIVRDYEADHVMLMGTSLAKLLIKHSGLKLLSNESEKLAGLLIKAYDRRWIASFTMGVYGTGGETSWMQASLLGHLYRHLELLRAGHVGGVDNSPAQARLVETFADWKRLRRNIEDSKVVCIDTETRNLEKIKNTCLTMQFGFDGKTGWVLPVGHVENPLSPRDMRSILGWLREWCEDGDPVTSVYHNAIFDLHQLITTLKLRWYNHSVYDTQAGNFQLDENVMFRKGLGIPQYALEHMALEYGMNLYSESPVAKHERGQIYKLPLKKVANYGAIDVVAPLRIRRAQIALAKWRDEHHPGEPYRHYEKCVTDVIGAQLQQFCFMERNGLKMDRKYVVEAMGLASPFKKETTEILEKLKAVPEVQKANDYLLKEQGLSNSNTLFGRKSWYLDFGKPAHQQVLFFKIKKLKALDQRKMGKDAAGNDVMGGKIDKAFQQQYKDDPVVKLYVDLGELKKLHSTFIVGIYKMLIGNPDNSDGRIRTTFKFLNVITGRASSTDPNLQNIPARSARAKGIKRQFISERGRLFLKRDFSAHEIRGWGLASGDKALAQAFWNGMITRLKFEALKKIPEADAKDWDERLRLSDIHIQNRALLFRVDPAKITKEERNQVKSIIFGAVYGKGIPSLSKDIKKSHEETQEIYDLIFKKKFPQGGQWLDRTKKRGRRTLRVVSPIGRVRHLYGHLHVEEKIWGAMDRRGPNSSIQGFGSDIGFVGGYFMRRTVHRWFTRRGIDLGYFQCNAVHDSNESECVVVNIPIVEYLHHHAYTTMVHRWLRDRFGFEPTVGFEMECEIGACLAHLYKADHYTRLIDAVEKGLKWGNENLKWDLKINPILEVVEYNAKIVHGFRRREIKRQLENEQKTNYDMLITQKNCLDIGLKFDMPTEKSAKSTRVSLEELEAA